MALALLGRDRTNYPYAVARIQAKRGKLIPLAEYDKIVKMSISEITRTIQESTYQTEVDELASRFDGLNLLEAALAVNEARTYESVRKLLGGEGKEMVSAFLMRNLIEDVKTVLRGKQAGASQEELIREMLIEDLDTYNILTKVLGDEIKSPRDVIHAFERMGGVAAQIARGLSQVPEDAPLSLYEDALDKMYFAKALDAATKFSGKGAEAVRGFIRREIDARNVQNVARWVSSGETGDFSSYVIPGGLGLNVADVMGLAGSKDLAALADAIQNSRIDDDFKNALTVSANDGSLAALSTAIRHGFFVAVDKLAHGNPLSLLPILTFLVRKRQEVLSLRAIARGKEANLSEERLRRML